MTEAQQVAAMAGALEESVGRLFGHVERLTDVFAAYIAGGRAATAREGLEKIRAELEIERVSLLMALAVLAGGGSGEERSS